MNGVPLLEWLYVAVIFCGVAWFALKGLRGVTRIRPRYLRTAEFWRNLPMALLSGVVIGGLLWFMLWMLTDGLVPHGLYGFGIASAGLVGVFVADAIKRRRGE